MLEVLPQLAWSAVVLVIAALVYRFGLRLLADLALARSSGTERSAVKAELDELKRRVTNLEIGGRL